MQNKSITVETIINAPLQKVWECWTEPKHITKWCFASEDWEAPTAENDLQVGGRFNTRMQAKDGSFGFDFEGTYTNIKNEEFIEYKLDDERLVRIEFTTTPEGVKVRETFDLESENSEELQRQGWQAILESFKKYVEASFKD